MKVVLDTNILVSGLAAPYSIPGRIVSAWRRGHNQLVSSEPLIAELSRVSTYPKILSLFAKAGPANDSLGDFLDVLRMKALIVDISAVTLPVDTRDVNDRQVLATMIAADAEWLVTGDKHDLLSMGLRNIVTARDFLSRLESLRLPPLAEQPRAVYRISRARRRRPPAAAQA